MKKILINSTMLMYSLLLTNNVFASPFDECPEEAYLSQKIGGYINYRAVNLATGDVYTVASNETNGLGSNTVNGIAFNQSDRYIYGFNMTNFKLIKFDSNFNPTQLDFIGDIPSNFYVADIKDNKYYVYKKNVGFYSVNLDSEAEDYLQFTSYPNSEKSIFMADWAFHPYNEKLYGVDNAGKLYEIDYSNGQFNLLGDTGSGSGTFGAAYFDINGSFYFVNNKNGNIFKVNMGNNVGAGIDPTAILFSKASPTSSNDGARCPIAPLPPVTQDYGDAPDSYGTTGDGAARHTVNYNNYFLGELIDVDADGQPYPDSDNSNGLSDEDGVQFLTAVKEGSTVKTNVTLGGGANAYLTGWLDLNNNGTFDSSEKLLTSEFLSPGVNEINFVVPDGVTTDVSTWMRFRLHKLDDVDVAPTGSMGYGEVEDYQVEIKKNDYFKRYYPSKTGFATVAFEDQWPFKGDYDFNDVVVDFRIVESFEENLLRKIEIEGELVAYGADYFNGFGFEISDVNSDFDESMIESYHFYLNGNPNDYNKRKEEAYDFSYGNNDSSKVILKIFPELKEKASEILKGVSNSNCDFRYYRTEANCSSYLNTIPFKMVLLLKEGEGSHYNDAPQAPYKPYIYLTKNTGVSMLDQVVAGSHDREVHLKGNEVTYMGDTTLFNYEADRSISPNYYQDEINMPWAILVTDGFYPPTSGTNIQDAYPEFADFINSGGENFKDWNKNFSAGNVVLE